MVLTRRTLADNAALTYFRDVLSQGRSLSNQILDLDLEKGTIWTYLRQDVPLDYAQEHLNETWLIVAESEAEPAIIVDGYRIRRKPTSVIPLYIELIRQFMDWSPHAYCVFEDALRKTSDPIFVARSPQPYAFQAEDVFYVLKHEDATPNAIAEGLKETSSAWVQIIILTSLPEGVADIKPWTEITSQQMSALVSNVRAILVSAFDGVGFIVWENGQ
jgi:hypothetical protein